MTEKTYHLLKIESGQWASERISEQSAKALALLAIAAPLVTHRFALIDILHPTGQRMWLLERTPHTAKHPVEKWDNFSVITE